MTCRRRAAALAEDARLAASARKEAAGGVLRPIVAAVADVRQPGPGIAGRGVVAPVAPSEVDDPEGRVAPRPTWGWEVLSVTRVSVCRN